MVEYRLLFNLRGYSRYVDTMCFSVALLSEFIVFSSLGNFCYDGNYFCYNKMGKIMKERVNEFWDGTLGEPSTLVISKGINVANRSDFDRYVKSYENLISLLNS